MMTMTKTDRKALANVIAQGGILFTHQGTNARGAVRTSTMGRLQVMGLVRAELLQCAYEYRGQWWPYHCYYATAAGCVAMNGEIATVS